MGRSLSRTMCRPSSPCTPIFVRPDRRACHSMVHGEARADRHAGRSLRITTNDKRAEPVASDVRLRDGKSDSLGSSLVVVRPVFATRSLDYSASESPE